ncbi:hypothetical protein Q5O24_11460 [Eubacteriaceae bacterium ES3]|nr:hypothetical protein Q5O24_11460 [Eubacteriaceae bacterium ES3]
MKKITASILTVMLTLSMVFSSSVFAAEKTSAWDSFLGLFSNDTATTEATAVGVQYKGHVENKGDVDWVTGPEELGTRGQSLRLEAFYIELMDAPADMHIMYRVHVQNEGWLEWVEDGALGGTTGKAQRIESVEIKLVDDNGADYEGYSVEYQGHVQNKGDMPADGSWYMDGAQLGTVGEGLRLEALKVQIVQTKADMTAYEAAVEAANALDSADYTAETWAELEAALAVEVTEDNTQTEVDDATAAINAAMDALVMVPSISSLEATGLKQLTVTFNMPVDTDVASFSVIKGTATSIGVSTVTWNDDATVATLALASKLTEATYTVNVDNLADDTLTASVDTLAETVTEITIASDIAVFNSTTSEYSVGYAVYNQYGENMTSKVSTIVPNASSGAGAPTATAATGIVTIPEGTLEIGDTTVLTLVDSGTGVSASQKLTCSDSAAVAEITLGEVYNEDGYELSADNTAEDFYVVVDAYDQYGTKLEAATLNSATAVVVSTTDSSVLDVVRADDPDFFYDMDINDDDVDETLMKLDAASMTDGTAKLTVISLYNGAKSAVTLTVAPATQVDVLTLEQPDLAVAGEDVVIPYEAYDLDGEAVSSTTLLNAVNFGFTFTDLADAGSTDAVFKKNASTGEVELILTLDVTDADDDGGKVTLTATTPTGEVTILTVTVEEAATPTTISGLDDVTLNPTVDGTSTLDFDEVIVVDQFDRVMDPTTSGAQIDVTIDDVTIADTDDAGAATDSLVNGDTLTVYGQAKGTTDVTFEINGVTDSEYTTSIRVAATSEFDSYTLSTVGTIYDDSLVAATAGSAKYNESLTVYGVTSNGTEVVVPAANYNVLITGQSGLVAAAGTNSTSIGVVETGAASVISYATDATEASATIIVTINASGEQYTQSLTISKVEPVVSTIVMGSSVVSGGYDLAAGTFDADDIAALISTTDSEDNYGEDLDFTTDSSNVTFADGSDSPVYYTVSDIVDADDAGDMAITGNGTGTLAIGNAEVGDSFTVTITADGVSRVFGVVVN